MAARPSTTAFRAAASAAVAAALLSACTTPGPQTVDGSSIGGGPAGTGAPTATTGTATTPSAPKTLPGPLTSKDLPGWKDHALPKALTGAWVSPCGKDLNVHATQATTRGAELTGPRGITVQTRVGTYAAGNGAAAALASADAALNACPLSDGQGGDVVTISAQDAPAGQQAVGAVITATNADGALTDVIGYWIAKVGNGTVEVRARGLFTSAAAEDPMVTFSRSLLNSALAKATGGKVPVLPAPQLAPTTPRSSGEGAGTAGSAGSTGASSGSGTGSGGPGGDQGAASGDIMAPAPEIPGVGGDDGPGITSGSDPGDPLP